LTLVVVLFIVYVLMYSPDGANVYGSSGVEFEGM